MSALVSSMRRRAARRSGGPFLWSAAWVLAFALPSTPALAIQESSPLRLWTDPVVATAGQPAFALVDVRGDVNGWCHYEPAGVEVAGSTLVLHLLYHELDPPVLCALPGVAPAGQFLFTLPSGALGPGFHALRLESQSTLGTPPRIEAYGGLHVLPGATVLAVRGDEFEVRVRFLDPRNATWGDAAAIALSPESGYFWFFSDRNTEGEIKVLDGRPVNGHWWVFFASQTTLEATIEVTHRTPECTRGFNPLPCPKKTYPHPAGASHNVLDTAAFADAP